MNDRKNQRLEEFGYKTPGGFQSRVKPGDAFRITLDGRDAIITVGEFTISINAHSDFDIEMIEDDIIINNNIYQSDEKIFVETVASKLKVGDTYYNHNTNVKGVVRTVEREESDE